MITRSRILGLLLFLMLLVLSAFFWVGIVPPQPRAIVEAFSNSDFVAFTPDSEILVTRQAWNVRDGTLLQTLDEEWAKTDCVIPAPDSRRLIGWIGGRPEESPNVLMTCDVRSGKVINRLTHPCEFNIDHQLIISPDGQWLAIAPAPYHHGCFYLWRIGSDQLVYFDDSYSQVVFSADGERLAATHVGQAPDGQDTFGVEVWRLADLRRLWKHSWPANQGFVLATCKTVATVDSSGSDYQVTLWDLASGAPLATLPLPEVGNDELAGSGATQILRGSNEFHMLWDLSGPPKPLAYARYLDSISPDGQWLNHWDDLGMRLRLFGLRSGKSLSLSHDTDTWSHDAVRGRFSPDSRLVIVTGRGQRDVLPSGFWQWLRSFFVRAPAQDWLFMARLWDVETGKQVAAFEGCTRALFSPDGQTLATLHDDGSVRLWDPSFPPPIWRILGTAVGLWVLLFVIGKAWRRGRVGRDEVSS